MTTGSRNSVNLLVNGYLPKAEARIARKPGNNKQQSRPFVIRDIAHTPTTKANPAKPLE
jgi:hypothetical protein